jgi:hypothetical protein
MNRMLVNRRHAAIGLAVLFLGLAGCSGESKPTGPPPTIQSDALKQEAGQQRDMHDRMKKNK